MSILIWKILSDYLLCLYSNGNGGLGSVVNRILQTLYSLLVEVIEVIKLKVIKTVCSLLTVHIKGYFETTSSFPSLQTSQVSCIVREKRKKLLLVAWDILKAPSPTMDSKDCVSTVQIGTSDAAGSSPCSCYSIPSQLTNQPDCSCGLVFQTRCPASHPIGLWAVLNSSSSG